MFFFSCFWFRSYEDENGRCGRCAYCCDDQYALSEQYEPKCAADGMGRCSCRSHRACSSKPAECAKANGMNATQRTSTQVTTTALPQAMSATSPRNATTSHQPTTIEMPHPGETTGQVEATAEGQSDRDSASHCCLGDTFHSIHSNPSIFLYTQDIQD